MNLLIKNQPQNALNLFFVDEVDLQKAYEFAFSAYHDINGFAKSPDEMVNMMLEDVIFGSLQATYFEDVFHQIYKNPAITTDIIEKFEELAETRENEILEQTHYHLQYVENKASCLGCPQCLNHQDLDDLIAPWGEKDMTFFSHLFIGTQAIQFVMDELLYRKLRRYPMLSQYFKEDNLVSLRQEIFDALDSHL